MPAWFVGTFDARRATVESLYSDRSCLRVSVGDRRQADPASNGPVHPGLAGAVARSMVLGVDNEAEAKAVFGLLGVEPMPERMGWALAKRPKDAGLMTFMHGNVFIVRIVDIEDATGKVTTWFVGPYDPTRAGSEADRLEAVATKVTRHTTVEPLYSDISCLRVSATDRHSRGSLYSAREPVLMPHTRTA